MDIPCIYQTKCGIQLDIPGIYQTNFGSQLDIPGIYQTIYSSQLDIVKLYQTYQAYCRSQLDIPAFTRQTMGPSSGHDWSLLSKQWILVGYESHLPGDCGPSLTSLAFNRENCGSQLNIPGIYQATVAPSWTSQPVTRQPKAPTSGHGWSLPSKQ